MSEWAESKMPGESFFPAESPDKNVLFHLWARLIGLLGLNVVSAIWSVLGFGSLAFIVADVVLVLPETARLYAPHVLGALGLATAATGLLFIRRWNERSVARSFERRLPELGSTLTNAVLLAQAETAAPLTELLRRQAVVLGRTQARRLNVWPLMRKATATFLLLAALPALLWALGPRLFPDVFAVVLPRFLDPTGDHPPYSRLRLETRPNEPEILFGGQCEISAVASGLPVESLRLVAENSAGTSETVMFRRPDRTFFQTLTNLREETRFWVTDGRARSVKKRIRIRRTPQITLLEVQMIPPAYTGLRSRSWELKETELRLPKNGELQFKIHSNRPLRGGVLELTPLLGGEKKLVALIPPETGTAVVAGGFAVEEAVAWSLSVEDVEGLTSAESKNGRVLILPDRPPRLEVLEPGRDAVATPEIPIPVRVRAEDDYGIAKIIWHRSLNGSTDRGVTMHLTELRGATQVEAQATFDLKDLGLRPGDRLEYFFEAADNWPDGPNVAFSRVFALEIISMEQYLEILRARAAQRALFEQYSALDNHLRRIGEHARSLRDRQEELAQKSGGTPAENEAQRKDGEALAAALNEYAQALQEALAVKPLFEIEDEFRKIMEAQREQVERLRGRMKELNAKAGAGAAGSGSFAPKELSEIMEALERLGVEMNREVGEPARMLASVARFMAHADVFTQLTQMQKELARLSQRLSEPKENPTRLEQMELQELAARQQRVRDGLRRFIELIPELKKELPDAPEFDDLKKQADDFVQAVQDAEIQKELNAAAEKFSAHNGFAGHVAAKSAAEKMEALVAKCDAMSGEGLGAAANCLKFQPSLCALSNSALAQILASLKSGGGASEGAGYGLMGNNLGLYGPDVHLAGTQGGGGGERAQSEQSGAAEHGLSATNADDPILSPAVGSAKVRLQRNAKFPLRYRQLVGDYFKAISEAQE